MTKFISSKNQKPAISTRDLNRWPSSQTLSRTNLIMTRKPWETETDIWNKNAHIYSGGQLQNPEETDDYQLRKLRWEAEQKAAAAAQQARIQAQLKKEGY